MTSQPYSQFQNKIDNFIFLANEYVLVEYLSSRKNIQNNLSFDTILKKIQLNNWKDIREKFPALESILPLQEKNIEQLYKEIISAFETDRLLMLKNGITKKNDFFIQDMNIGEGDFHMGKSTSIVKLNNNQKLVYKSTNGLISNSFFVFLDWIDQFLDMGNYRYKIHNQKHYHWQEFVTKKECNTCSEVSTYYKRAGYLLCILYVLNSIDFHAENIIARGDSPVLIDHETILLPQISDHYSKFLKTFEANLGYEDSVYSSVLLPNRHIKKFFNLGMCGLGCSEQTYVSGLTKIGQKRFTKDWSIVSKVMKHSLIKENIPELHGENVFFDDYIDVIVNGFQECYKLFMNKKEFLLYNTSKSFKNIFNNIPIRYIWRNTSIYDRILKNMSLPKNLKDEKEYEQKIRNYLAVAYNNIPKDSDLWLIYEHEVIQMLRGDIPYFEINSSARDLVTENGTIKGFFKLSCVENIERKLHKLSNEDLEFQKQLIIESIAN